MNWSDGLNRDEVHGKVSSVPMTSELSPLFHCGSSFALARLPGLFLTGL